MGTNYYARVNICDKCGRYDDIHLGKSSMGWQFSFQFNGGQYYKNVRQMKEWLKDKIIVNEYNEGISQDYFWKMVKEKQKEKLNHAQTYSKEYSDEFVIGGYSFSDGEFS